MNNWKYIKLRKKVKRKINVERAIELIMYSIIITLLIMTMCKCSMIIDHLEKEQQEYFNNEKEVGYTDQSYIQLQQK